jgi:hypothetical protein
LVIQTGTKGFGTPASKKYLKIPGRSSHTPGPLVSIGNTNLDKRGGHGSVKKIFENSWEALTYLGGISLDV